MDLGAITLRLVEALGLGGMGLWWFGFVQSFLVLGLFALAYIPLERTWRLRDQGILRARWATDLAFFFGQYWLFGLIASALLSEVREVIGVASPAWFVRWPFALQVVFVVALGDLCAYWAHRAQHRYGVLWRFHAVHHTSEHLDWLAAHREHPLDGIYTQLAVNLPAMLLGFGMGPIFWLVTARGMWSIFIHSNARLPLGPLKYLLGAPELHHWHHSKDRDAPNYGNLAPWTDLLFGTHACPPEPPHAMGIEQPAASSYLGLLLWPFMPARTASPRLTARQPRPLRDGSPQPAGPLGS